MLIDDNGTECRAPAPRCVITTVGSRALGIESQRTFWICNEHIVAFDKGEVDYVTNNNIPIVGEVLKEEF